MKFYDNKIVDEARNDRRRGVSIRAIGKKLNIPDATVCYWVYDIDTGNKKQLTNHQKIVDIKKSTLHSSESFKINQLNSRILCSMIYWCEGAKYPTTNFVAMANSDELLIQVFIKLFRRSFTLDENKFRVQLQLHDTHNEKMMISYWAKKLKINESQFHKSTITTPKNVMKRKNYNGTCTVKYYDVKVLWQIIGLYEALGSQINGEMAEWLKAPVC